MYYTHGLKLLFLLLVCTSAPTTIAQSRCRGRSCPAPTRTVVPTPQTSFTSTPVPQKAAPPARKNRTGGGNVVELRPNQELDPILDKNPNTVLYFYGTVCEPCHWMRPHLEAVMPEYPQIKFVIINVDHFPILQMKYNIKGWPTLVPFKNGTRIIPVQDPKKNNEQYEYLGGPRDENEIRTVLDMIYKK